jgi:hypothetical protein
MYAYMYSTVIPSHPRSLFLLVQKLIPFPMAIIKGLISIYYYLLSHLSVGHLFISWQAV